MCIVYECDDIKKLGEMISPIKTTIYGETFKVYNDDDYNNIANTKNEIQYHMDLQYYDKPPGVQMLLCTELDNCIGGENSFVDIYRAVNILKNKNKNYFDILTKTKIEFCYKNKNYDFSIFKPIIELDYDDNIKNINYSFHWEKTPHFKEYDENYIVAYNELINIINSCPKLTYVPQVGQCILFLNDKIIHSRTKFKCINRTIVGCYLDSQEFKAKYKSINNVDQI